MNEKEKDFEYRLNCLLLLRILLINDGEFDAAAQRSFENDFDQIFELLN